MDLPVARFAAAVRARNPLIHSITNYVVASFQANALSALGASPIMADEPEEAAKLTGLSDGLVVNIGTLNQHSINAMYLSAQAACRKNIPRVLDPVGVGASYLRQHTVHELLQLFRFSAIRGNAGEIAFLAQAGHRSKGIDAGALEADPLQIAQTVARRYQSIVVMTGAEDYITDGHTTYLCRNGHSMMAVLVGTGCIASAVVGAFIAAHNHNMLEAAAAAISFYGLCGETAAASAQGPGSLQTLLLDNLYHLPREAMDQGCRLIRL